MLFRRVIPQLLLSERRLVKTRNFKKPKYVGDPINAIKIFNEKEVDELIITDISLSINNQDIDFYYIEKLASECFMPLSYGGGIKSLTDVDNLISLGVEKITIHKNLFNEELLNLASSKYGNQAIIASLNLKNDDKGEKRMLDITSGQFLNSEIKNEIQRLVSSGVGEILLTDIDKEGTLEGIDLGLVESIIEYCPIPLIFSGGTNSLKDMKNALDVGASAIAIGASFVFYGPHRAVLISYPSRMELDSLSK